MPPEWCNECLNLLMASPAAATRLDRCKAELKYYLGTLGRELDINAELRAEVDTPWQSAFSEFYFTDVFWPAFRQIDFLRAVRSIPATPEAFRRMIAFPGEDDRPKRRAPRESDNRYSSPRTNAAQ